MNSFLRTLSRAATVKDVAVSLWREGKYADARELLQSALADAGNLKPDDWLTLKLCLAMVIQSEGDQENARQIFVEIAPAVDRCGDPSRQGRFYCNFAYTSRRLGLRDEAIMWLTAGAYYHEKAGDVERYSECENNLGNIYVDAGDYEKAHEHFQKALKGCKNTFARAHINESIASAYLSDGRALLALPYARKAVELLEGTEAEPQYRAAVRTLKRVLDALDQLWTIEEEKPRILAALAANKNRITPAARALGMKHGSLVHRIKNYHPDILAILNPPKKARGIHVAKRK